MRKGRLGRGLEALLGESTETASYRTVPVDSLKPREDQPRLDASQDIEDLVESVKRHGLLQPIVVVEDGEGYRIVAGERRWLAAKKAGFREVPVVVGQWNARDVAVLSLVENLQRKDLDPVEEALYYRRLMKEFGFTQEEISHLVGKSRAHVANVMRVLKLPEEVCEALRDGRITLGHAKALMSLKDHSSILKVFDRIIKDRLSVRDTEELVKILRERERETTSQILHSRRYNLKLKVSYGKKRSKVVIIGKTEDIKRFLSELES